MESGEDASLIHGLSNLNLLQGTNSTDAASDDDTRALKEASIKAAAAPALAGIDHVLESLREVIGWPTLYSVEAAELGVRWPRGVLLHGPPGTGKSAAVAAIAAEFDAIVHLVTPASIVGAYMGESERRLREVFAIADDDATSTGRPVVIFMDDVDALCPRRVPGQSQQHEARIVGQLLTLLDGAAAAGAREHEWRAHRKEEKGTDANKAVVTATKRKGHVVIIATTSRPNALDPALRRPGRFDREISVGVPDASARAAILKLLVAPLPLGPDVSAQDVEDIASKCYGYTGADLRALCREATTKAVSKAMAVTVHGIRPMEGGRDEDATAGAEEKSSTTFKAPEQYYVTKEDFEIAMRSVGPSVARNVVREFPPAAWDDIGGLEETKRRIRRAVEWPILHPEPMKRMKLRPPRGVLLHGPPGCAKTTLARAAATASGATFIPLQGASLYSMYVGEGEAELREAFRRARMAVPSIVFVDELDMLVGSRGGPVSSSSDGQHGGNDASARLLSTLLNEMDGLELATGVMVLATTNRPQGIDSALLRPGRFDAVVYVPPPDALGRAAALRIHSRRMPLAADVDLDGIAERTGGYTGAELAAVCKEAAMAALREDVEGAMDVKAKHFEAAIRGVRPALTPEELARYEAWPPRPGRT